MRTTTTTGRMLLQLAEPMTDAMRAEIGADRARRVYRRTLRTAARARRAARLLRTDAAATLLVLATLAGRAARGLRRAAGRIDPPTFALRRVPFALVSVADLAPLRAALAPSGPTDPPAPADVPDLTGGRSFRAVAWEPETFAEPTAPAAPTGPQPWGVDLPTPRRIDTRRAPTTPPVVPEAPAPEVAPTVVPEPVAEVPTEPTPEPVKPTRKPRTRKPAAPKVQASAARATTPPPAPTFTSVDEARAALGSSDVRVYGAAMDYINAQPSPVKPAPAAPPAVYLADVRPMTLSAILRNSPGRFGAITLLRTGWATDSKILVRVPDADRPGLIAQLVTAGHDDNGRAVPVKDVLPASIDPRPFVLTGRAWDSEREPVGILTREDGATEYVDLKLYLTLLKHSPKGAAVYRSSKAGTPLVASAADGYTRETAAGVIMPLSVKVGLHSRPWEDTDEPLTLSHKAGSVSTRYAMTRGEWDGIVDYLQTGRPAMDSLVAAAEAGATVPSGAARLKLAGLIDLAGGAPAVRALLGLGAPAAAAAA